MSIKTRQALHIALISPKGPLYRHKGGIFKKSLRYQPLTLTTLAALVPPELHAKLTLIDEGIEEVPTHLQADLVAMTVITGTAARAYQLAARYRAQGKTVVLGGPHVTLLPHEAQEQADCICVGYAEDSWPQLLRDYQAGCLRPRYDQAADFTLDRAGMPYARRDLLPASSFLTQAVFEATRSCAHNCEFCVAPAAWGRKQFQKPIDWVVGDIRQLGAKRVIFIDLNLISDKVYAKELFRALIPLKIQWFGLSTVLLAHDSELLELLARSGCRGLLLGLETVSRQSTQAAGKQFNSSVQHKTLIQDLHQLGISVQGCFVFGLDGDTPEIFDDTVEFAIEAGVDLPRFSVLTPFPGTPLYHRLQQEERILIHDWSQYDGQHVVFQPRHMTPQQLAQGHQRAWKKVYSLPNIVRRLWKARNFQLLALTSNLGYRFYAHNLHRYYTCDWPINALPGRAPTPAPSPTAGPRVVCG